METTQNDYGKVVKRFLILLGLLFLSPILLSFALKAIKTYTSTIGLYISYTCLILSGCLLIYTVYFGIRTIKILLDTLFNE